jgi:hypothetical protein
MLVKTIVDPIVVNFVAGDSAYETLGGKKSLKGLGGNRNKS